MAVNAKTAETYDSRTLKEDLAEAENMISPDETPFFSMIAGRESADREQHEWPFSELNAVDHTNAVAEGEDDPAVDDATPTFRRWNFTQIMDKVVKVSDTANKVEGDAAKQIRVAKQVTQRLKELKRDKEAIFTSDQVAAPGSAEGATVRNSSGMRAMIQTNALDSAGALIAAAGVGNTAGTLSDAPHGYVTGAPATTNTGALTEDVFNSAIQVAWEEGGEPRYSLVSPGVKTVISQTFNAYANKYKDADDGKLVNSVGIYESDFGMVSIIPDRFIINIADGSRNNDLLMIDPDFVQISELQPSRQIPLARTGHTENRLVQCESCVQVGNEKAHSSILGITLS